VQERREIARQARDASKQHMSGSSMEIMDVNPQAVLDTFAKHGVSHMIHGHTHRPAFHEHSLDDGTTASRIVLSDWYREGSVLRVTPDGTMVEPLHL
jgi:UDP-2,3-diacylglucosamine hydrolase